MNTLNLVAMSRTISAIFLIGALVSSTLLFTVNGQEAASGVYKFAVTHDEFILVDVDVLGRTIPFCCDTGATNTFFDSSIRDQLGPIIKRRQFTSGTGTEQVELFAAPEMTIRTTPPLTFRSNEPVGCGDLSPLKLSLGVRDFGVLGMDFLHSKVLHLNFDKGVGELKSTRSDEPGYVERMRVSDGTPRVTLRLSTEGLISFRIDTGSAHVITLNKDRFSRFRTSELCCPNQEQRSRSRSSETDVNKMWK